MATIWINARRQIVKTNDLWNELAEKNNALFLSANHIEGTSLLSFVKGDVIRMFLDSIISRVLVTGKPYILNYRCDSGTTAKFMRMMVKKEADNLLSIEHEYIKSGKISPGILFTEDQEATEKRCAICGKVEFKKYWYDALTNRKIFGTLHELKTKSVICPACDQSIVQDLKG